MDPFSITAGVLQIATACGTCTVNIIQWIEDVRTVDVRIQSFVDEVIALQNTYDTLNKCLASPQMLEAARAANSVSDGADLWTLIRTALYDSIKVMDRVNKLLDKIKVECGAAKKIRMQLHESLKAGELSRLRSRIQFVNATISLPIQMGCLLLQQDQRGLSIEQHQQLEERLISIDSAIKDLAKRLNTPSRTSTMDASTLIVGVTDDDVDPKAKESYLTFARRMVSSASAAVSTRSNMSVLSPHADVPHPVELPQFSTCEQPMERNKTMSEWIKHSSTAEVPVDGRSMSSQAPQLQMEASQARDKTFDVDLMLTQRHLDLAQDNAAEDNHESAEKRYRKALDLFQKHDFSGHIPFTPADVVIMLSQSCLRQQKYEESITLLVPVAEGHANIFPKSTGPSQATTPTAEMLSPPQDGKLQALAASHMLGEVYLLKKDFEAAQKHTLTAFLERRDSLGDNKEETLESLRQLIKIYHAMDDKEEAEAYEGFLPFEEQTVRRNTLPQRSMVPLRQNSVPTVVPTTPRRESRPSFASRIRKNFGKASQPEQSPRSPNLHDTALHRRSAGQDALLDTMADIDNRRGFNSPSEASTHDRTGSYYDEDSTTPSSARLERSASTIAVNPLFQAVAKNCVEKKYDKAVKLAMSILEGYGSNVFIIRRDELEKNIRKGNGIGLAATGKGYAPIHFFIELKEEHTEEVDLLIKSGVDVNAVAFKAGYTSASPQAILTPLHLAIERGHSNIAKLLIDSKPAPIRTDLKNGDGMTPLLAAMRRCDYAVVERLLALGPQVVPAKDKDYPQAWHGNTPLHDAARHCDITLVDMLLTHKLHNFDLNAQDKFGKTPLMHAVIKADVASPSERRRMVRDRVKVVHALLRAGADPGLIDHRSKTARSYAEQEEDDGGELLRALAANRWELP